MTAHEWERERRIRLIRERERERRIYDDHPALLPLCERRKRERSSWWLPIATALVGACTVASILASSR